MKTAIDFYERGKQKEVNADEYNRKSAYGKERFICPECGELVYLTGNKNGNHFAHYKKSTVSMECDKRVDGEPTDSVYVRVGLPIYIRKNKFGNFNLYMGFKALPLTLMETAMDNSIIIRIDEEREEYQVNQERFSCDTTTLIPLMHIPSNSIKYTISYMPIDKAYEIKQHWSDYADGFSDEGALFEISGLGGRKVRHGDTVTTDVGYYWVRSEPDLPSLIPGIQMEVCGRLILKNSLLVVFQGIFRSDITEDGYTLLAEYLRNNLGVYLLEKQPEFIPIWPPIIKTEEGYVVDKEIQEVYGYIQSGNDSPKAYIYHGIQKSPVPMNVQNSLAVAHLYEQFTFVNVDRKYVSSGVTLLKRNNEISAFNTEVCVLIEKEKINIKGVYVHENNNKILLISSQLVDCILVRSTGQIEKYNSIREYMFCDLVDSDSIFLIRNRNLIARICIKIEDKTENISKRDRDLCRVIKKLDRAKQVKIPYKIKIKLIEMKKCMPLSKKQIIQILETNCIALPLIKIVEEIFYE